MERGLSLFGGLALGWYGLRRRARLPRPMALGILTFGSLLIARGATAHCTLYRALGLDSRGDTEPQGGRHLEHRVTVQRPAADVYGFWRKVENWPLIMPHLKSVTAVDAHRFHCTVEGPTGATVTWDAAITEDRPNERIAWESMTRTGVNNRGLVEFHALASDRTEVRLSLTYNPAAGPVGIVTEHALGEDPAHRIHAHLEEFKRLMEPAVGAS
jgi:uncharacterized membrane protein